MKLIVTASVVISLILLLSIGASYTGLFYLNVPKEEKSFGEWEMVGKLEVREGEMSFLPTHNVP